MTYPPSGGTPDPYQPQQPYGQGYDPNAPASGQPNPYGTPTSGQPGAYGAPTSGQPGVYGAPQYPASGQPYGQNPYGQPQYPPPHGAQQGRTNSLAIASLVCSLAGLVTCISAPVGVVLGHIALRQVRQTGEQGEGMAKAGLWVGYIVTVLGILGVAAYIIAIVYFVRHSDTTT
jgi:hypothetical protein